MNEYLDEYAELIIISGPELFSYIYDKDEEALKKFLVLSLRSDESIFSVSHIIADICDDKVRGMILALPVKTLKERSWNERKLIREYIGSFWKYIIYLLRTLWRIRIMLYYPKLMDDEFFISNLAVYNEYRGMGIASKLLNEVEEKAKSWGFKKISLYVEVDNENAIALYRKYNFKATDKKVFPGYFQKFKIQGFYKMVKQLE